MSVSEVGDPTGQMTIGLVFAIVILLYVIFGGEEEKK